MYMIDILHKELLHSCMPRNVASACQCMQPLRNAPVPPPMRQSALSYKFAHVASIGGMSR